MINKEASLKDILERLTNDASDLQITIDSGVCSPKERKTLHSKLIETVKRIAKAQQAVSQHTTRREQLGKLTFTAQSAEDIERARELVKDYLPKAE